MNKRADKRAAAQLYVTAVKSKEWKETLKKQEWEDFWLPGDEYAKFIAAENKRIVGILADLGLNKK